MINALMLAVAGVLFALLVNNDFGFACNSVLMTTFCVIIIAFVGSVTASDEEDLS